MSFATSLGYALRWVFKKCNDCYHNDLNHEPRLLMLLAAVSGVSALVTGTIGIVRSRERSVLVFLATAVGLFVLIFSLSEILFPH